MKRYYKIHNLLALQGIYEAILSPSRRVQQHQSNKTH